jgi:MoaA/NifB/PqqE/SkfB family radical SAM enzyme
MLCDNCGRSVTNVYRVEREGEELWVCEGELTPEEYDLVAERNRREG